MQKIGKSEEKNDILITKLKPLDEDRLSISNASSKEKEKEKNNQPPSVPFLQLFRFSTGMERFLLFIGILGAVGTGMTTPANVWLFGDVTKSMVDFAGMSGNSTVDLSAALETFAIWNSVLGVIMLVLSYISVWSFTYVASRQILRIRDKYLLSALSQDIAWYDMQQTGDFASRMAEDLQKLEEGVGDKVVQFAHFQFAFVGSLAVAFTRGYELAFVCLSSLPVTLISIGIVSMISSRLAKKELTAYGKAGSIAQEALSSIRTVIAFGGENVEIQKYRTNLVYAKDVNIKRSFFSGLGFGLLWFFIYASYALAFWYGTGLIIDFKYEVDDMVTVFFCVMMASMNFGMASPYIDAFATAKAAGAKVFSVIDRVPEINSLSMDGKKLNEVKGNISFSGVHFVYPSRPEVTVLQGLNLDIKRGEKVALVGSSGCGKSTCIQLIQRFYDPLEGSVLLDGVDVKELNVSWLRSNIGVVGQEPVLFGTTISENIRYGCLTATAKDIEEAAREANAHDFIMKLPQGYSTLVGERGAQLSGGQKQRIAIARALVRKPSILLLDEATSALDTTSEAVVQKALDKVSKGRTTVIVAHRLSTIRTADKIVVLKNGRIVEQGQHDDLMNLKGHYYGLVTAQLVNTEEDDEENEVKGEKQIISRMLSVDSTQSSIDQPVHTLLNTDANEVDDEKQPSVPMFKILEKNKEEWHYIVLGCIGSVVMGCAMPVFAVLFGDIIGVFQHIVSDPARVRSETNQFCMYFVIAGISVGLATFLQIFTFGIAGEKLTMRLRGMTFEAMLRQEVAWFDEKANNTGALCARLSGDAASVQGATGQRIGVVLQNIATLFLGMGLAFNYEWRLGLVTLSFTPIILFANFFYHRTITGENLSNQRALEKSSKVAVEAVSNIRTVASLGQELLFHEQYMAELRPANAIAKRNSHFRGVIFGMARSIMFFAYSTCIFYGGKLVVDGEMSYENVFKVSQALIMGTVSIANAMAFAPNFQKGLTAAAKIFLLLERKPQIYDPLTVGEENWVSDGYVDYRNVEFFYPTRPNVRVLRGLNLKIKKGQTVALVGQSGCGKSTCVQLLERFYDPVSGTVNIDERDISSVKLHTLRAQLGIVSQEPVLFDRTIAENIAYGDNTRMVDMSEIIEVAKKANIHNFISSLPQGYDTPLGEKGTQLSGGQKQRVAIARALVRNPRVLLLDEATSALDTESEKVVQEALDKAKEGRTCITIAHRLSTIQDADVICVIHHGKIAEMGTHSQLVSQRGLYYKLCSLQNG